MDPENAAQGVVDLAKQAVQVPAAIRDINASPDPTTHFAQAAKGMAEQGAGQALLGAATEGVARGTASLDSDALSTAMKQTAKETGKAMLPDAAKEALKFSQRYEAAKAANSAAAKPVLTDPAAIASKVQELTGKTPAAEAPKPTPASTKSPATQAKIGEETAALRARQTQVDGKPVNPDTDFTSALKETLNRLGKGEAGQAGAPGSVTDADEGITDIKNQPVTKEMTREVPARGFLNKAGADEQSVLKTDEDHARVQYQRAQIQKGTMQPVELHVDQDGNVIGADGRHRAVAAIQEGGPNAKIKVRVVQHPFQGTSQ
jgi:hypothetical protein